MTTSDTPETDAITSVGLENADRECVPAEFARQLEHSRDEWAAMCGRYKQERDEAITRRMETIMQCELYEQERDEARRAFVIATDQMVVAQCKLRESNKERDEARESLKHIGEYGTEEINAAIDLRQKLASALVERDEAQKELSSIHRWIERNHADGFIDSLTYLKNLERVMDCWYDRLDKIERERDDLQKAVNGLCKNLGVSPANTTLLAVEVLRIQRERDEAREAFKIVYNERVQMELERNEWKNKAYSHATDYTLMEAKCFRLEQQLKEYDKLKS